MKYIKHLYPFMYVPWRLLGVLFYIDLVIIVFTLTRHASFVDFGRPQPGFYVSALLTIVYPIFSGVLCLRGSGEFLRARASDFPARGRQTRRFSPLLWGMGCFIYASAQMFWVVRVFVIGQVPAYSSYSHMVEFLSYFSFIGAVLLLPTRSLSPMARWRILLDSLIIIVALATLCYYFVLGPLLVTGKGPLLARIVGSTDLLLDLLALLSVLVVMLRAGERLLNPVLMMVGLAAVLQFVVNMLHLTEALSNHYNAFSPAGAMMAVYATLLVGASQTVNAIQRDARTSELSAGRRGEAPGPRALWKRVLPSVLALVFGLLIFLIWLNGAQTFPGQIFIVYIGGLGMLVLMLLRQILAMYQIGGLQATLQGKNRSLDLLNTQLERQATTDSLTGLPNHRALAEKLDEFLERTRATSTSCALIFMDIDHFKDINDTYGHLTGDRVLSRFTEIVSATVRRCDAIGRWGGEEFVAILPETELEEARAVAEQIRVATIQQSATCAQGVRLTCSLGVATYPQDASEREELIKLADRAMYMAKRLGRDQVHTACELPALAQRAAVQVDAGCTEGCVPAVDALQALVEVRDPLLGQHLSRVATLARQLAWELGLSQEEAYTVYLGGRLHDLGNIAMSDEQMLRHRPWGKEDLERVAAYYVVGANILEPVPALRSVALIIRSYQEWVDGSGYPNGLKGEEIPLGARIVAVAGTYDLSLVSQARPGARASVQAFKEICRYSGSRFDPRVVEALRRVLSLAPRRSRVDVA
ncbi:MAG TPA: diguanylate cyclase [Ktedonobacteraceae bacterium]